jgi:D-3-phosphoglycerate dehydrogenase
LFKEADFITLHVPAQDGYIIGEKELAIMKMV